jgi:hypothetical protein
MECYAARRQYADGFLPAQLQVLSQCFGVGVNDIAIANADDDQRHATDAMIDSTRIALRIRRPEHLTRYRNEITIRTSPGRDGVSEWAKVERGDVRYLLYAFAGESGDLSHWTLIDLRKLDRAKGRECYYDGGSFLAFDLSDCRAAVVASARPASSASGAS